MPCPVSTVERSSSAMVTATGNTAAASVMPTPERKQLEDLLSRLMRYKVSTTVLKSLLGESDYVKPAIYWPVNTAYLCAVYSVDMTCYFPL